MTLKLVKIDPHAERNENIIAVAKVILAAAEAGELADLSYAASNLDGSIRNGFSKTDDSPRRLASVARLLHRLNNQMDEVRETVIE